MPYFSGMCSGETKRGIKKTGLVMNYKTRFFWIVNNYLINVIRFII